MFNFGKRFNELILEVSSVNPDRWGLIEKELFGLAEKSILNANSSPNNTVLQNRELAQYEVLTALANIREKAINGRSR